MKSAEFFERPDELVDHLSDLNRHGTPGALAVCEEKYRRGLMPLAKFVQQRSRLRIRAIGIHAEVPIEQDGA